MSRIGTVSLKQKMNVRRHWWNVNGIWVCIPPKCGTTAAREALGRSGPRIVPEHVPKQGARLMAVRCPIERFESLWRDKCRDHGRGIPAELHGASPDELIKWIAKHPKDNHHWIRQSELWLPDTELVDFKQLLERLGYELPKERNQHHPARADDPKMPIERILKHYADDVALYEAVQGCRGFAPHKRANPSDRRRS